MTLGVISVTEDVELSEVVRLMQRKRIKRVPVVRNMELVGIISRADLIRALGAVLAGTVGDAVMPRSASQSLPR